MFDTYNYRAVTESVTRNVNVTEKRAPTDESVRLLLEMYEKAEAQVLAAVRLDGCPFEAVMHRREGVYGLDTQYRVVYRIGSERRTVDYTHKDKVSGTALENDREAAIGLRDALAQDVANLIASAVFRTFEGGPMSTRRV